MTFRFAYAGFQDDAPFVSTDVYGFRSGPETQLGFGWRFLPFLSVGIALHATGGWQDGGDAGGPRSIVAGAGLGLYARGHLQQALGSFVFDPWLSLGVLPLGAYAGILQDEPEQIDADSFDPESVGTADLPEAALGEADALLVHSVVLPIQAGVTFWLLDSVGIEAFGGIDVWLPSEAWCPGADGCVEKLDTELSWQVGGGIAFLL